MAFSLCSERVIKYIMTHSSKMKKKKSLGWAIHVSYERINIIRRVKIYYIKNTRRTMWCTRVLCTQKNEINIFSLVLYFILVVRTIAYGVRYYTILHSNFNELRFCKHRAKNSSSFPVYLPFILLCAVELQISKLCTRAFVQTLHKKNYIFIPVNSQECH